MAVKKKQTKREKKKQSRTVKTSNAKKEKKQNTARDCLVKRRGHEETYDHRKVYASVYAACLGSHYGEQRCEQIAENVSEKINTWIRGQMRCVDSTELRKIIAKELKKHDSDIAFMYETHLDVS